MNAAIGDDGWQVFIAYPGRERAAADELYDELVPAGANVFLDHIALRPGHPWMAEIPGASRRGLLHALVGDLRTGANVNLIGERRMGRTSMLNHLHGRLLADADMVVARVNLQDDVTSAGDLYGVLLWGVGQCPLGEKV